MGAGLSARANSVFDEIDVNKDGTIDADELGAALASPKLFDTHVHATSAVCAEIIAAVDLNRDGRLQRDEFTKLVAEYSEQLPTPGGAAAKLGGVAIRVAFLRGRETGLRFRSTAAGPVVAVVSGEAEEAGVQKGMRVLCVHDTVVGASTSEQLHALINDQLQHVFTVGFDAGGGAADGEVDRLAGAGGTTDVVTTERATDAGALDDDGGLRLRVASEEQAEMAEEYDGFGDVNEIAGEAEVEGEDLTTPLLVLSLAGSKLGINLRIAIPTDWGFIKRVFGWTRWLSAFAFAFPDAPSGFGAALGIVGGLTLPVVVWLRLWYLNQQVQTEPWDHKRSLWCCCERNRRGAAVAAAWLVVLIALSSGAGSGAGAGLWLAGFVALAALCLAYHGLVMLARQYVIVLCSWFARLE